jgi:hypothetical protein
VITAQKRTTGSINRVADMSGTSSANRSGLGKLTEQQVRVMITILMAFRLDPMVLVLCKMLLPLQKSPAADG